MADFTLELAAGRYSRRESTHPKSMTDEPTPDDSPALFGNVYASTPLNPSTIHADPDCPRLSNAATVHGPMDADDHTQAEWCEWCVGDAADRANGDSSRDHLLELREAYGDD